MRGRVLVMIGLLVVAGASPVRSEPARMRRHHFSAQANVAPMTWFIGHGFERKVDVKLLLMGPEVGWEVAIVRYFTVGLSFAYRASVVPVDGDFESFAGNQAHLLHPSLSLSGIWPIGERFELFHSTRIGPSFVTIANAEGTGVGMGLQALAGGRVRLSELIWVTLGAGYALLVTQNGFFGDLGIQGPEFTMGVSFRL